MTDKPITDITTEQIVEQYVKAQHEKEELEAAMKVLSDELLLRLGEQKGMIVGAHTISKTTRVTFKTTIEEAEQFGAVKKAVDTKILKGLYDQGVTVPGANISTFVSVRTKEAKE